MKRVLAYSVSLALSVAGFSLANSVSKNAYPESVARELSRKVSPVLQIRTLKKAFASKGVTSLEIEARDLEIEVLKSEKSSAKEIRFELEGRFAVENKDPLKVVLEDDRMLVSISENLRRKQWLSSFSGPMKGNRLQVLLPASFSGKLKVLTISGSTSLALVRNLSEFEWESVSGNLQVSESELFVTRLSSVSGNVEFEGAASELSAQFTSGDASFKFSGLDRFLNAKLDLFSTSGRMEISIPKSSSIRYSLSSLTGALVSDLPGAPSSDRGTGASREGQLHKGVSELRARTISGDLIVNKD